MFIATGATGQLGRLVVAKLLELVPAAQIGVSVRNAGAAADLTARGIRVREADFDDADALHHAFEGARRILLVSSNAAAVGGDSLAQHRNAIEAAKAVGVERLLYTSQMSSSPDSHFPPGRDHAATEAMLAESGLNWTALRHGFYAGSALMMNRAGFEAGMLVGPEDGKVVWTAHEDLAEADTRFLAGLHQIDGPTPPLTGAEALDLSDLARIGTEVLGRDIGRRIVSEVEMAGAARQRGLPEPTIEITLGYFRAAKAGEFAQPDPTLQQMLGRKPQGMRDYMAANLVAAG
ncbi:NAD(P)H-binding protein [Paracoccus caeni]|uniref:NAD(P)H-binding protein n=1 Tax=Paracoccus caeni TaxID=657651 RepID=A0A934SFY2_9RHOB|nr:NAD(P)H-binding protein [Paracoccus caeni]MBK4216296.1 NAD(P)H-binding protein [Paracoccus caeni]